MAQEGPLTPEKQLLKLIEEPGARDPKKKDAAVIKRQGLSLISAGAWTGRAAFFKDKFSGLAKGDIRQVDVVKVINNFLGLSVLGLLVYFGISSSVSLSSLKKMPSLKLKLQETAKQASILSAASPLKEVSIYIDKVKERNIFKIGGKKPDEVLEAKPGSESQIAQLTQQFKLVGISWSDDPDAMIEDIKSARTMFIKKDQMIGELKVKEIFKDKVVFSYGKDEMELR